MGPGEPERSVIVVPGAIVSNLIWSKVEILIRGLLYLEYSNLFPIHENVKV